MNALRAQAVAARSFALSQNRYSYAKTCDTSSCQVYGGCGDVADADLGRVHRRRARAHQPGDRRDARRRAPPQRRHRVDRVLGVERPAHGGRQLSRRSTTRGTTCPATRSTAGPASSTPTPSPRSTGSPNGNGVATVHDTASTFDGIWANKVVRGSEHAGDGVGLPQRLRTAVARVRADPDHARRVRAARASSFIGDSVGVSVAGSDGSELRVLLDGVFALDDVRHASCRAARRAVRSPTVSSAAAAVPVGTELVVVELGYNDDVRRRWRRASTPS